MPLITLDQAPLKKAFDPSSLRIFLQQSIVPLYMMSAVEMETWIVMRNANKSMRKVRNCAKLITAMTLFDKLSDAHLLCAQTASSYDV